MKLWHLGFIGEGPGYDCNHGFVIRSETEEAARGLAESEPGAEAAGVWLDGGQTFCRELTGDGESGIVLQDFNAG